jgi:PAS domain S-box-containing protein
MTTDSNGQIQYISASESFSDNLLRNAPNPIVVVNSDSSISYVNPAFEQQTGFTSEELLGQKPPFSYWIPETQRQFQDGVAKGGSGAKRVERQYQRKDGERFWVELSTSRVSDMNGPAFVIAVWIDITERKQAEHGLRESEKKSRVLLDTIRESEKTLRTLLDAAPDSAWLIDLEGNVIDCNRIAAVRFSQQRDALIGKKLFELMSPAESLERKKFIEKAISIRKRINFEDEHDENVYANQIRPVFDGRKKVTKLAVFERNITHRKQVEDRLNHALREIISSIRYYVPVSAGTIQTNLTVRESAITRLLAEGKTNKEVALELEISLKTVESFRTRIMQKLEIYSIAELTKYAVREGLTAP